MHATLLLRPWHARDLARIAAIEREAFGAGAWTLAELELYLENFQSRGFVAELGREVVGYAIAVADPPFVELENLAVARAARRQGVARRLVAAVRRLAERAAVCGPLGLVRCRAIVRETNLPALRLLAAEGFRVVRLVKDYYEALDEAAVVFVWQVEPLARLRPRGRRPATGGDP